MRLRTASSVNWWPLFPTFMQHSRILYLSIVVALAGLLFGFDTVVISGADKYLQTLWQSSDLFHGWVVMSAALWGTVVGALLGSYPTNLWGRRTTLIAIGGLFLVSALGSALVSDPYTFGIFRMLGGLGIGISTVAAPAFVSEIAPPAQRGRLVALYQFNIVLGILLAFVSNYLLDDAGPNAWRWMLGVEAAPALLYLALVPGVPESPRWLLLFRKDQSGARQVLERLYPEEDVETHLQSIQESQHSPERGSESIFQPRYRRALWLAFFIAFFNQVSGINAFLYYAPRIFELAGLGDAASHLSSVGVGLANLLFTVLGLALIDRLGRKTLMYVGSVGYILSLGLVALAFSGQLPAEWTPVFFFLFIASHAVGQGAVIWVFIAEIFPNHLRASGSAFGSSVHWVLAATIPALTPQLFSSVGPAVVFAGFAGMMVLQLIWVRVAMPETKGKNLEELADRLSQP